MDPLETLIIFRKKTKLKSWNTLIVPKNAKGGRCFQGILEFKIFLRSWQDIQDVKRWVISGNPFQQLFTAWR